VKRKGRNSLIRDISSWANGTSELRSPSRFETLTHLNRHGEGHLVFTSGDEYKGHFHGGVYGGGEGELICGEYHYVGEWRDGKRCGKGRCVLSNCDL
jgi:hypothetical protein